MAAHKIRMATLTESKKDCCGDRYPVNVAYVCSCGLKVCREEMRDHAMEILMSKLERGKDTTNG